MNASSAIERRARWGDRARARLRELAPAGVWRVAGAFAATMLTVLVSIGGLLVYAAEYQAGLMAGVCASLIAPSRRSSAAVAAVATFLGVAFGPAIPWDAPRTSDVRMVGALAAALLAAGIAFACRSLARRVPRSGRWLAWAVVALIVANVWVTTVHVAGISDVDASGQGMPSLFQALSGAPVPGVAGDAGDSFAYLQVLKDVERGDPFYRTWHDELGPKRSAGKSAGSSVFNYNLPTRFWFWAVLPGSRARVVYAYLVLVSIAVAAVPFVVRGTVRLPLAIPAAAAVGTYLLVFGYWLSVLTGEPWAGALVLLSVTAWARSSSSDRWRVWTVASVVLGVLAALVREPAVLVPVAGFVAAALVRDRQRRFRVTAWSVGLVLFAGAYLAHYLHARPLLWGTPTGALLRVSGLDTIVSALTTGTPTLGLSGVLPLVLAGAGFLGIAQLRDVRTRLFAGLIVASSLLAYLFVSNGARNVETGTAVNYWGTVIVPTIYACLPAMLAFVPAMSPDPRPDPGAGPGRDRTTAPKRRGPGSRKAT